MIRMKAAVVAALSTAAVVLPVTTAQAAATGGTISGTTWHDVNADGFRQADEPGLSAEGLRFGELWLHKPGTTINIQARPDDQGRFRFDDVPAGTYQVKAADRDGVDDFALTKPGGDSRADWATGLVTPLVIGGPDTVLDNVDIGYFRATGNPGVGTLTGTPEGLEIGDQVRYDFDVLNNGDAPATAWVTAGWPAGLRIVTASGGMWLFNPQSAYLNPHTKVLPGVPHAASITLQVVGPVEAGEVGVSTRVTSYGDSDPTDNAVSTPFAAIN